MNHDHKDPIWPPAPTGTSQQPAINERQPWLTSKSLIGAVYGILGYGIALIGVFVLFISLVLLMNSRYAINHSVHMAIGASKDTLWDNQRFAALVPVALIVRLQWKRNPSISRGIMVGGLLGLLLLWLLFPPHPLASD